MDQEPSRIYGPQPDLLIHNHLAEPEREPFTLVWLVLAVDFVGIGKGLVFDKAGGQP
jgi:hypothetical protein